MLKPIVSGTYAVNEAMIEDFKVGIQGQHASNLGGIIANEIVSFFNLPVFIVDPVVADELDEVERISGIPKIERKSIFHALNQKAVVKRYAKKNSKAYGSLNLIVTHMGGEVDYSDKNDFRVVGQKAFSGH